MLRDYWNGLGYSYRSLSVEQILSWATVAVSPWAGWPAAVVSGIAAQGPIPRAHYHFAACVAVILGNGNWYALLAHAIAATAAIPPPRSTSPSPAPIRHVPQAQPPPREDQSFNFV